MRFLSYSEYKDSGVEWLGLVPKHWVVERMKRSIFSSNNGVWGNEEQGDENDIPCVRVADFDRTKLSVKLDNPTIRNMVPKERDGRVLFKGNLLLEKSGGGEKQPVGCVVLYEDDTPAVCSNFIARVELAKDMDPSFWRYVHAAAYDIRLTLCSIKQTSGIQNLDQDQYFNELCAYPPSNEQSKIAIFLDRETNKLDKLITEQEKLITLLKEKRQAVISHTVAKGLNPDASLKDSRIEWVGEVPSHWEVVRLKHVLFSIESGTSVNAIDNPAVEGEIGVLKVSCVYGGKFEPTENKTVVPEEFERVTCPPEVDTLIVSRANTPELVGSAGLVKDETNGIYLSDKLWKVRFSGVCPAYVHYWTLTNYYRAQVQSACSGASSSMQNISIGQFRCFFLPKPPLEEQYSIVTYLDIEINKIDKLLDDVQIVIKLLKERRNALISAAVTGKIDVRGLVEEATA